MEYEAPKAFNLSGGDDKRVTVPSPESCKTGLTPDKQVCSVGSSDTGADQCKCFSGQQQQW